MHRSSLAGIVISLAVTGCATDAQLRVVEGTVRDSYWRVEGLSFESGGRERVMIRESNVDAEELTGRTSVLLYLSFPVQAGQGLDVRHPQVYLVWSDIAAEFSGFLNAQAFQPKQQRELRSLSGTFSGTVHSRTESSIPRDVTVTLTDVPLIPAESPSEIDRRLYSEMLREHLHNLESNAADPEDGPPATNPGASTNREDD